MADLSMFGSSDPRLAVGRPIRIFDADSDIEPVETRIVGWERDLHKRAEPRLELSNERRDMATLLTSRRASVRHPAKLVPGGNRGRSFGDA
jgi:hypothetical protein